ncbi:BEL1-like homeodomain protein 8 [Phytophthora ramorum]|uniref:BEL1-like homeodomain protein 8 n=1 Tax=Phytophthora ramorum TaxID=164328 RepID=UPI003096B8D9|nr:BEL1-like homeodomain protein 8 [Phytophthora ramorum]
MMTAQQQSADQVKSFAYPHGTPAAAVDVAPSSVSETSSGSAGMSGGTAIAANAPAAATSPPTGDRKRKEPSSPADDGANGSADTSDVDKKEQQQPSKKSRRELPPHTVAILKGWMLSREHVKHPYPTDEDKQMLLKKTGISMKQLTNWFTNARKRIWKPMMRREHSRQLQSAMEFDQTAVREFPGSGLNQQYTESSYAPRPAVRHSFDAGSLGVPPHPAAAAANFDRYARPQAFPVNTPMYPPRAVRSMSEAPARTDVDDYLDAERIRERVQERGSDERAPRNSLSPRGHKILQEWVNTNARREYPYPNDTERLQLARDTGLDVSQVDGWVTSLREQMGTTPVRASSIPSAGNPAFPPPPAYGQRRSIPTSGNPMFPPRPTAPSSMRPSIPSAGNSQFPPPPVRREASDSRFTQYSSGASHYPGHEVTRMRSMTISSSPYLHPLPAASASGNDTQAQQAASALPSLSSRSLLSRPPPIVTSGGPTMGQPRDGRSRTLDMGQFADARRRKMNFQDILASTGGAAANAAQVAATSGVLLQPSGHPTTSSHNMENVYPNSGAPSTTAYAGTASSGFQQKHPSVSSEQESGRVV